MTQLPRGRFWLNFSTKNLIPPALNVVQDILECKLGLFRGRNPLYSEAVVSCTFAGQK